MKPLLPSEAPRTADKWEDIMSDVERVIMPGVSEIISFFSFRVITRPAYRRFKMKIKKKLQERIQTPNIFYLIVK